MWTNENRSRYDRSKLHYPSDVTDEEWALIGPLIPGARRRQQADRRRTGDRQRVDVYFEHRLPVGALPKDLPPRSTVNDYFRRWDWDGTLARIHHALYVRCREQAGREASPTAAIIDSQSVKGAEKGGARLIRRAMTQARGSKARSGTSWSIRKAC